MADIPFAPLIWHTINTMMPLDLQHRVIQYEVRDPTTQCCLTPDEVYSLTAYLLYRNGIIEEDDVMDAETLPGLEMPNRNGYTPPPYIDWTWKPGLRKELVK